MKIRRSELLRNISILVSGTALAQLIPILLQPVLRRIYSPETFGAYSVYLSLVGIFAIVASLKYDLAIVLPRKQKNAANVFFLSIFSNILVSIFLFIIVLSFRHKIIGFLNIPPGFSVFLFLAPVGILLYSSYQCINNWLIREKSFIQISINKFVRRGSEGIAQIGFNSVSNSGGIIFGDIIGHFANIITGMFQARKKGLSFHLFSPKKIIYEAKKYSDFPKFNFIPGFMSACSYLLPAIILNKYYSSEITGYYDLSKLVLSIPLALISGAISNVLLQRLTECYRAKKTCRNDIQAILSLVGLLAIAEILIIYFFGIGLFRFFFGEEWENSGVISRILVWSYTLNFITASFSAVFISFAKVRILSIWQVFYFLSIFSLVFFTRYDFLDFFRIYVIIEIVANMILIWLMFSIIRNYEMKITVR